MHERVAVSAAIFSADRTKVLGIQRAPDPEDILGGLWGLPAITLGQETEAEGIARIGWQKLGTPILPVRFIGEKSMQREANLLLRMRVWECQIETDPNFDQRDLTDQSVSQYLAWQWLSPRELVVTAQRGSLCTQVFLESQGIIYERKS